MIQFQPNLKILFDEIVEQSEFLCIFLGKKKKKISKRKTNLYFPSKKKNINETNPKMFLFQSSHTRVVIFRLKRYDNTKMRVFEVRRHTKWIANIETP